MWYTLWIYSWSTVENTDANRLIIFCSSTTPQAFLRSSAPGALSTLVTYVVLYSLTRTTLMSPGKNEIRACRYALNFFNEHCREHYFSSCTTPQALRQSSPPDALRTLVTSVVLYSLTRATVMSPGKDETRVCGYTLLNLFIEHSGEHWWEENILFVHPTTSILAKLSTWCLEHSGDISCSLLVNPSHTHESWEGRNTCLWI